MAKTDPQLRIRLPPDIKAWLTAEAARNGASQNSEIVRALRERMERATPAEAARPMEEEAPAPRPLPPPPNPRALAAVHAARKDIADKLLELRSSDARSVARAVRTALAQSVLESRDSAPPRRGAKGPR